MVSDFFSGVSYIFRGMRLIFDRRFLPWVLTPILISITVFIILLSLTILYFTPIKDFLFDFIPDWPEWIKWLLYPVIISALFLLLLMTQLILSSLIAAPFNTQLSHRIELHLSPQKSMPAKSAVFAQTFGAIRDEIIKISYFLIRALPILLLYLIPVVNILAAILWVILSIRMLAMEFCEYPMGNHDLSFKKQRELLKSHRTLSFTFGGTLLLLTMIPFINVLLIPSAVAGATLMWMEKFKQENRRHP